ncbi:MAG TPA: hypothetical protein VIT43_00065, partial [Candidatus Dormibacteraeota bacterium]
MNVSNSTPSQALTQVSQLPPAQLLSSLGSVSAAVHNDAAQAHQRLVANPPQRVRASAAPATLPAPGFAAPVSADPSMPTVVKPAAAAEASIGRPPDLPHLPEAVAPSGQLATHDPARAVTVGPLPHFPAAGNADPTAVQQHQQAVIGQIDREHRAEAEISAQPFGEDSIFPAVQPEILRAHSAQPPATNGHTMPVAGGETDEAASIIAQQEKGAEIRGAVSAASSAIVEQKRRHAEQSAAHQVAADADMAQLEKANAHEQTSERAAAKSEVVGIRGQWSAEQEQLVAGARSESELKTKETLASVSQERTSAEAQAAEHYRQGQEDAERARRHAEAQAAAEKQKAQSGGLLGTIGSAAQSLFDKARHAVQSVFDAARQLVRSAIERARQLAMDVLERARTAIVNTIRAAGTALSAIGDRVLVAFPTIRDRFRRLIRDRISAAEAAVNRLATMLKSSVQTALDGLSKALIAAISLMQAGMRAAVDGLRATIRSALDFAKGAISAFGAFASLVKDVAANPGQWLSNLAAGVRDGIANQLWPDLKAAVQSWFNDKVDSILGLGSAVWSLLKRGGITVAQVVTTAWEGLKAVLPQTVIWVLIEKLVSLIVPAAAAVMLIIQALQAAWSSVGRIVQALDAFVAFLKGVRRGNAGPLFGTALAKGAVAVIEFISQFLLQRLMGAAGAVAGKIRVLAKRIGARLAAVGRRLFGAGDRVVTKAKQ